MYIRDKNMQLHQLQSKHRSRKRKRIGRGGKRGTYSGRGIKGQKAHAGRKIRPAERDLIIRLPKLRGFKNRARKTKTVIVNVGNLDKRFDKLVKLGDNKIKVKILGAGEVNRAFDLKGKKWAVSQSARNKIKAAGGSIK